MDCTDAYDVNSFLGGNKVDYCVHLAGFNGGIQFNKQQPAAIYSQTAYMALNVLENCFLHEVKKVVSVLPSCAYSWSMEREVQFGGNVPEYRELPRGVLYEKDFLKGESHPTVACHGMSKRILFDYSRMLYKQFQFNSVCCVLNNCFGPGARYTEPDRLKVADSMIQKFILAKRNNTDVNLFGTGKPLRELMYCKNAADGIAFVLENYDDPMEVINIGPGHEISMRELAIMVKQAVGFEGNINWDTAKPDGQLRKLLSSDKIAKLGWRPKYNNIEEAIVETVKWYEETYK